MFWQNLKKPFFALAPMADVTDIAFRQIIAKYSNHGQKNGGPDVFFTEFVSCDGLCSEIGRKVLLKDLKFTKKEQPIIAQVFGSNPENFKKCAKIIKKLGFSGIDINMGCPDKKIEKQGAGAALIKNPELAREIIKQTKISAKTMPVSIKTRIGYNKNIAQEWIAELLKEKPAAITIHARTRKEMSNVPANWDEIAKIVKLRDKINSNTLIIGNGDIKNLEHGRKLAKKTGVDGVMIGRGIFGNPWFFNKKLDYKQISQQEKLKVLLEHTKLFEKLLIKPGIKNFAVMKKHFKAYTLGFASIKNLRVKLMKVQNYKDVEKIVNEYEDLII